MTTEREEVRCHSAQSLYNKETLTVLRVVIDVWLIPLWVGNNIHRHLKRITFEYGFFGSVRRLFSAKFYCESSPRLIFN